MVMKRPIKVLGSDIGIRPTTKIVFHLCNFRQCIFRYHRRIAGRSFYRHIPLHLLHKLVNQPPSYQIRRATLLYPIQFRRSIQNL